MDLYIKHQKQKSSTDVIVRSTLNCDGYEYNGRFYRLDEVDELKAELEDYGQIGFHKGLNTFTGKPVSDKFFESMVSKL